MKKRTGLITIGIFMLLQSGCSDSAVTKNVPLNMLTQPVNTMPLYTFSIATKVNTQLKTVPVLTKDESMEFNTNFIKKYQKGKLAELNKELETLFKTDIEKMKKLEFRSLQPNKEAPVLEENIFSDKGMVIGVSDRSHGDRYLINIYMGDKDYNINQGSTYSMKEILDADPVEKYNFAFIVVFEKNYISVEKGQMIEFEGKFYGSGSDGEIGLWDAKYQIIE